MLANGHGSKYIQTPSSRSPRTTLVLRAPEGHDEQDAQADTIGIENTPIVYVGGHATETAETPKGFFLLSCGRTPTDTRNANYHSGQEHEARRIVKKQMNRWNTVKGFGNVGCIETY